MQHSGLAGSAGVRVLQGGSQPGGCSKSLKRGCCVQSRLEKPACAFWLPRVDSHLAASSADVRASMSAKLCQDSFELQCMQEMGNGKANRLYEAFLPENFRRPQTDQHPFFAAGGAVQLVPLLPCLHGRLCFSCLGISCGQELLDCTERIHL